ncbi:DDE-type integrase/transposase/recombinase [Klebsiella pneumoniae]|uniref:DDE-type integrase/transposase/recombinase n=1 Tax=Klebsiella pneumoniae TaxID=573 RepID=UPI0039754BFC
MPRGTWRNLRSQWPLGVFRVRAVDSRGRTVDFYLSSRRNSKAAYRFLGKILNNVKKCRSRDSSTRIKRLPMVALALLKREGRCMPV